MPKVSLAFFTVAPIYVLIGMGWGMYMGASGDHTMSPAHAHLNLLGFVQMGLFGAFYGLAAGKYSERLAWVNFWLSNFAVVYMIPLLAIILAGNESIAPAITVGELAAVAGMAVFLIQVLRVRKAG
jgi:hypothetical protein